MLAQTPAQEVEVSSGRGSNQYAATKITLYDNETTMFDTEDTIPEPPRIHLRNTDITVESFETVRVIGRGSFGQVRLVKKSDTGNVYAMKSCKKREVLKWHQVKHLRAERDVLVESTSPWLVQLFYSFQDQGYIHLVTEYLPGGDFCTLLMVIVVLPEEHTKFYMGECVLAIEALHNMGYAHRDIKPDNILLDRQGHVKLVDFGLSADLDRLSNKTHYMGVLDEDRDGGSENATVHFFTTDMSKGKGYSKSKATNRRRLAYSAVGALNYTAPEIMSRKEGYGKECDWWSLGVIFYESLVGRCPFPSDCNTGTAEKVVNWPEYFYIPGGVSISLEAEDLIRGLLNWSDKRLTVEQIRSHPFFADTNWNSLHLMEAPYIPRLDSEADTTFFPECHVEDVHLDLEQVDGLDAEEDSAFLGFTFERIVQ